MINFNLNKRIAIVTGGAQGFGYAITERFIKSGAKVVIWDVDENEAKKALEKAKAKAKQYSSGPQKGKMSNKEMSEYRDSISNKKLGGAMLKNPKKADLDKDGNKTEPMKKAAKDKEAKEKK